jgi:type IV secretory pathway TrbL component
MKTWCAMLVACCVLCSVPAPVLAAGSGVENVTAQFADSAKKWENTIKGHTVKLFWLLATIAAVWTFAVLVTRQADWPDLIGAVVRFVFVSWFFYWVLDNGSGFAQKILESTQQIGDEAAGTNGLDYGAFAKMGLDVLVQVSSHISIWSPIIAGCALLLAILILIAVGFNYGQHHSGHGGDMDRSLCWADLPWVRCGGMDQRYGRKLLQNNAGVRDKAARHTIARWDWPRYFE